MAADVRGLLAGSVAASSWTQQSPALAYQSVGSSPFGWAQQFWNVQSALQNYSIQRCVTRPSMRFQAGQGDYWGGETGRIRSELQSRTKESFGVDVWIAYSVKVSASPGVLSDSLVLGQFHQTEDSGDFAGYPPFELNLHSDGLHVFTATVPEPSRPLSYSQTERAGPINFPLAQFNGVVIQARFGWNDDALLNVWINGNQEVALSAFSMGMNDLVGPYWKMGVYFRPDTAAQTINAEYQNWERSSSSLIDRVANPLPTF